MNHSQLLYTDSGADHPGQPVESIHYDLFQQQLVTSPTPADLINSLDMAGLDRERMGLTELLPSPSIVTTTPILTETIPDATTFTNLPLSTKLAFRTKLRTFLASPDGKNFEVMIKSLDSLRALVQVARHRFAHPQGTSEIFSSLLSRGFALAREDSHWSSDALSSEDLWPLADLGKNDIWDKGQGRWVSILGVKAYRAPKAPKPALPPRIVRDREDPSNDDIRATRALKGKETDQADEEYYGGFLGDDSGEVVNL